MTVQRRGNYRMEYWGGAPNIRCHGCRELIAQGALYCYLDNATDRQGNLWGMCCAHQFPLAPSQTDLYPTPEPVVNHTGLSSDEAVQLLRERLTAPPDEARVMTELADWERDLLGA